jgi:hypothetical protein
MIEHRTFTSELPQCCSHSEFTNIEIGLCHPEVRIKLFALAVALNMCNKLQQQQQQAFLFSCQVKIKPSCINGPFSAFFLSRLNFAPVTFNTGFISIIFQNYR